MFQLWIAAVQLIDGTPDDKCHRNRKIKDPFAVNDTVFSVFFENIVKDQIDVVILSYGMNDFLAQAPINNSDRPWTGFGTALSEGVKGVRSVFPQAQILITSPNYASYFPIPVKNMGEKALYNYASIACDVAVGQGTLCVDAYDNLGVDAYNADEYLEDGIHLNEKGRSLYAKTIASCLLYGTAGQISGNNIASFN